MQMLLAESKEKSNPPSFLKLGHSQSQILRNTVAQSSILLQPQLCLWAGYSGIWKTINFQIAKDYIFFFHSWFYFPGWGFRNPHIGSDCQLIQSAIPIPAAANKWSFRGRKHRENKPTTIHLVNWTVLYMGRKIPSWCPQVMSVCPEAWDTITLIIILACIATNVISGHKIILLFGIIWLF